MRSSMMGPRQYILNAAGEPEPCDDLITWGRWMETGHRQICDDIAEDDPTKSVRVSTIFLGLDHNWSRTGPPVLWETMIFAEGYPDLDGDCRRYTSREDALKGHQAMCEKVNQVVRGKAG